MSIKYAELQTTWRVMDVRNLELGTALVDIAIIKGTLDDFIHGSLWDPPEDVRENVGRYVDEVGVFQILGGKELMEGKVARVL
jgi:hypothetical protein